MDLVVIVVVLVVTVVTVVSRHVNYHLVVAMVVGLALYHTAPRLCRSTTVHYTSAVSLGVGLSLILLCYLLQVAPPFPLSPVTWPPVTSPLSPLPCHLSPLPCRRVCVAWWAWAGW